MVDVRLTPAIHDVLKQAAASSTVSQACRDLAGQYESSSNADAAAPSTSNRDSIPWTSLRQVVEELRECNGSSDPWLHQLCQGSGLALLPPPRRMPTPDAAARLAQLQIDVDNKRYAAMVADITSRERDAEDRRNSVLPTMRLQVSFAMHLIVTMGTFFATGYYGGKMCFDLSETGAALAGTVGLMSALLLETILLIIRSNRPQPLEERFPDLVDSNRFRTAMQQGHRNEQQQKPFNVKKEN